ncbi:hypothetical protein FCOIX_1213 [Fusarium coicis]|nr:hypothetical protein FCOIX_1213 [Fusarium coicis]
MAPNDNSRGSSGLLGHLPAEVLNEVFHQLPNIDLKTLRQTCTYIKDSTHLRLNRLFLSSNLRDIEVFKAVADHETFRLQVTEIIYDDARFDAAHEMEWTSRYNEEKDIGEVTGVPEWYRHVYRENREDIRRYSPHHIQAKEALEHILSPAEGFKHFKRLWQEQQETIATSRDADALKYGMLRFPNLRRVPLTEDHSNFPEARDWDRSEKDKWRGYCLVSCIVAQHLLENPESKLAELAVDTNQLRTGISCRIFDDAENSEIKDLKAILSHPGFASLDLSLHCGNHPLTNVIYVDDFDESDSDDYHDPDAEEVDHLIPLQSILPVKDWHQLRHFGLCRFIVKKDDVINVLEILSPTLTSVELSYLIFMPDSGDYHSLVQDMRQKLGWRERKAENQPKIVVRVDVRLGSVHGAYMMDVSREVTGFMYQDGENPFDEDEGSVEHPYVPQSDYPEGNGRLLDAFDPSFERPNASMLLTRGR